MSPYVGIVYDHNKLLQTPRCPVQIESQIPLPVSVLANPAHCLIGVLPYNHPHHDRCGERQAIPAEDELNLSNIATQHLQGIWLTR